MNGDHSAVIESKNLFRLFAALLILVALAPMALAGATMDCANPKLPPVRIKWACTVVIKANPKAAFAYVARADAMQVDAKLGGMSANFYALLADYSKAIELDPSLVSAYLGRAHVNSYRGTFKFRPAGKETPLFNVPVLEDLTCAIELDPRNLKAVRSRAFHFMTEDRPDKALADYETVVRLKPHDDDSYTGRAWAHLELGNYAQAVADYDKSFKLGKKRSAFDVARRGLAHSLNGNDVAAIADYDIALGNKGGAFDTYLNRAFSLYSLGRYQDAAKALNGERETVTDISWKLLRFHALYQAKLHRDPAYMGIQEAFAYNDLYKLLLNLHEERADVPSVLLAMENQPVKNKCIVHFFVGQWQIYKRDLTAAKVSFQNAIDICPRTAVELAAAKAALKKL
jgi:tetratricopeptide (TPR) repeat protein